MGNPVQRIDAISTFLCLSIFIYTLIHLLIYIRVFQVKIQHLFLSPTLPTFEETFLDA